MFIRTQENYREVLKSIVGLKPDLRIFGLTLFNTGGRDLPGARELLRLKFPDILRERRENFGNVESLVAWRQNFLGATGALRSLV